ncbi:MAG: MFS transporter [Planctomycetes bacterium]|nr:MFS transporter [Planctomycetota bacterium]
MPAFRWYFLAMLGQNAGMNMQMLVRAFLTFELTGSFTALGVMSLASAIPMLLLSPVGGVIADRLPKRYVLQVGQTMSMLNALGIAALLVMGMLRFEHLFAASLVQGTTFALMGPSRQSMVPEIVGSDRLMNAIALQSSGMSTMRLVAPAVGGVLLAAVSWQWVYFLMAGMYFIAIVTLSKVPARRAPVDPAAVDVMMQGGGRFRGRGAAGLSDLVDGMRYVAHHPVIFMVLAVNLFVVMLSMPYQQLLAGFVKDVLHEGPGKLGLLMSITGVGSLAGSLVIASLPNKNRGKIWLFGVLVMGFALLAFSLSRVFWVSAAITLAIGVGQTTRMSLSNIIVQSYVDDAYRGRVMSIYMMEFGVTAFGTFAIAILASAVGVETDRSATVLSFQEVWPAMDPSMPLGGVAFKDRAFAGEQKLASAVLRLTHDEQTAVVFVRHGGRPFFMGGFAPNQPPAPFAQIKLHLEDLNFTVHEWDLAAQPDKPEIDPAPSKTIYIVFKPVSQQPNPMNPQPQSPFGEAQRKALLEAVADSGRALFLVGWNPGQFGMPARYEFAGHLQDTCGIEIDSGVLLLRAMGVGPGQFRFGREPFMMRENVYSQHPIVERLGVLPAALPMVCPLKPAATPPEGVTLTELVRCNRLEGLWGVKNLQAYRDQMRNEYQVKAEGDLEGPFTVASAAWTDESKVVVISSQDFFADGRAFARQAVLTAQGIVLRSANPGNLTLLVNSLHWLNDNTEIMDLGQPIDVPGLTIEEGPSLSFIKVLVQGLWPLAVLMGGGAVWYVRRR